MHFNRHSGLDGRHAILSPSQYHWINYTDQKLSARWHSIRAAARGVALHKLAHDAITLGVKLPGNAKTLNKYVNDALKYELTSEQPLYYSDNAFGTPDTLGFKKDFLRVHDLKTGIGKASEHQLEIYAALFCLEYGFSPFDIRIQLRIYQNDEVRIFDPFPDTIAHIMDKIVTFDELIEELKGEVYGD